MIFLLAMCLREQGICEWEIPAILPGSDLDLHDGDEIVQVLDHLSRLLGINRMTVRFILFCMQNIEFAPATSVWKRAVVGNEKPAAQAQRTIVGTDTQSCTAKSQD